MKDHAILNKKARKERAARLMAAVLRLLDWSDMDYSSFQYESGLLYLRHYLKCDDHAQRQLSANSIFWNWWKNHWTNRDQLFMSMHEKSPLRRAEIASQMYKQYNDGKLLAACIHPNSVVLNETYATMITELVDTETAKAR